MTIRIANAAGFWGDSIDAPRRLLESAQVDYLTLEYLAELTLSIMARQRERDPRRGYAGDFVGVVESLLAFLGGERGTRIVTNAGGLNPTSCATATAAVLCGAGLRDAKIAVVSGDDLLGRLDRLQDAGAALAHLDSGRPLSDLDQPVISANAYLGARPIAEALAQDAAIVITGRVADASLTVGPAVYEFAWPEDDWDRLAAASVAGHAIECGTQVTGGYSTRWRSVELAHIGYPIAEMDRQGGVVVTKPPGSGGAVNRHSVAEQLVYEIGDPAAYMTPDVVVDFTTVELAELVADRVAIRGATGRAAPTHYKVSLAYADGYTASGQLLVYGRDCIVKAQIAARLILDRLEQAGIRLAHAHVELLGAGDGVPGLQGPPDDLREVVLRLSVRDPRRAAVARFAKEFSPLITSGPAGLAGYAQGRPTVRPVYAFWPTVVSKDLLQPEVIVRTAERWSRESA